MRISDWSSDVCSSDLDEALRKIDFIFCLQRSIHHTIINMLVARQLGSRQQLAIAHATQGVIPFGHGFGAPAQVEQRNRTLQTGVFKRLPEFIKRKGSRSRRY